MPDNEDSLRQNQAYQDFVKWMEENGEGYLVEPFKSELVENDIRPEQYGATLNRVRHQEDEGETPEEQHAKELECAP